MSQGHRVPDFFQLLGVGQTMDLDPADLDARWKSRMAQVHPDRFAAASSAEKRIAMQWSAQVNEAYETLRDPLKRARYLCALHDHPVGEGTGSALDMTFLELQMRWRESLEDLRAQGREGIDVKEGLNRLNDEVNLARDDCMNRTAEMITAECWPKAVAAVQQWLFIDKFIQEITRARHAVA